ncbi:Membrane-anchored lipid-binding protein LAM5 [Spathaspora sp. JA1]|nr:Membrane-anchored lipid-binding protein LAM5 [Spathaspora sp. JA1]
MTESIIEEEEDAWSYSFPPSTDSLIDDQSTQQPQDQQIPRPQIFKNGSAVMIEPNGKVKRVDQVICQDSGRSRSTISLQSTTLAKAAPLDPLTTKEDASSVISKEGSKNALHQDNNSIGLASPPRFLKELQELDQNIPATNGGAASNDQSSSKGLEVRSNAATLTSPKIITYRKSKRTISEGTFDSALETPPQTPVTPKYDTRLYVDEMYRDTSYRYSSLKRNIDYHSLFPKLDLTDRLIDDYACALSREILLQGRIYISENYICFNSNLLGWVTSLVLTMDEIVGFEKKSTVGLFPNGISIETNDTKHTFASFISRDATFELMTTIWSKATGRKNKLDKDKTPQIEQEQDKSKQEDEHESLGSQESIGSYIMTIDGDDGPPRKLRQIEQLGTPDFESSIEEEDEEEEEDEVEDEDESSVRSSKKQKVISGAKIIKLKPDSPYENNGPDAHLPTLASFDKYHTEVEIIDEIIDAPLGIVFSILFGPNTKFQLSFLESHDGSEVSPFDKFTPSEEDPKILERKYTYRRALGYSVGPKSTRCEAIETIEYLDLADYAVVVVTTTTPDVPSGGSFKVKTRYAFSWANDNKTNVVVTVYIEWTGTSWVKGIIERSSISGSTTTIKEMLQELRKEIANETYTIEGPPTVQPTPKKPTKQKVKKPVLQPKVSIGKFSTNEFFRNNIVSVCYLILSFLILLLVLQLRLFVVVNETNEISRAQLMLNAQLTYALSKLQQDRSSDNNIDKKIMEMNNEVNNPLWEWTFKKFGKQLSPIEKVEFLTFQLQNVYRDEDTAKKDYNFHDIKQQIRNFEYPDFLNIEHLRRNIQELL